jgi:hypothetical protein
MAYTRRVSGQPALIVTAEVKMSQLAPEQDLLANIFEAGTPTGNLLRAEQMRVFYDTNARFAFTEPVSNLRVGDHIATVEAKGGSTKVIKSVEVEKLETCDRFGRYVHVNGKMCYTVNGGTVRIAR